MKRIIQKALSVLLVLTLVSSMSISVFAGTDNYSGAALNTGFSVYDVCESYYVSLPMYSTSTYTLRAYGKYYKQEGLTVTYLDDVEAPSRAKSTTINESYVNFTISYMDTYHFMNGQYVYSNRLYV